jgi:prepilin-type N-terminal cleavage/methylation domain-containing protein
MIGILNRNNALSRSGFSLIELMVVIVIIGLMVGWAVPNFSKVILRIKLQNSARELTTVLRKAGRYAMTNRLDVRTNVQLYNGSPANSVKSTVDNDIRSSVETWAPLPAGYCEMIKPINITYMSTTPDITFKMYGSVSPMPSIFVTYYQTTDGSLFCTTDAPLVDDQNNTAYNTITIAGSQRVRQYLFVHN